MLPSTLLAIALGATLGAWLRYGLSQWLNPIHGDAWPWGTLTANALGGFLIGLAIAHITARPDLSPLGRGLVMTGFLGGLTTFSTFSAEVVGLITRGDLLQGLGLALVHCLASFALTALGLKLYPSLIPH